ncbi:MAG: 4Fe-4S binding protein [Thermoguttaceae bacterium]
MKHHLFLDSDRCILCGGCVDVCPCHSITMVPARQIDCSRVDWYRVDWGHEDWGRVDWGEVDRRQDGSNKVDGNESDDDFSEEASRSDGYVMVMDEMSCIRCRLCVRRCPTDAITVRRFKAEGEWVHE